MKKKLIILLAALGAVLIGGGITALILLNQPKEEIAPAENTYAPRYESFYDGPNDPGITIDGVLDEDIWQNKNWFRDAFLSKPNVKMPSWRITSHMTELGLYVAVVIEDSNLLNDGQHTMEGNSNLEFYYFIANVGEAVSGKGGAKKRPALTGRGPSYKKRKKVQKTVRFFTRFSCLKRAFSICYNIDMESFRYERRKQYGTFPRH